MIAATDRLDGYLAWRLDVVSSFGSTVDAVADKAVQFGPLFYFAGCRSRTTPPGRVAGFLLFALLMWITADLPAIGVTVGGLVAGR